MEATFTAAQQRAIRVACSHADRFTDPQTGLVLAEGGHLPSERESFYGAIAFYLTGEPERVARAEAMVEKLGVLKGHFAASAGLTVLKSGLPDAERIFEGIVTASIRHQMDEPSEDAIAGRNINIPLQAWVVRIAGATLFGREDLREGGIRALEMLTDLVAAHGTIPEFNSMTYHAITLQQLRNICRWGDPESAAMAAHLERHLWEEMAWRWHPRIRLLGGPWGRAYEDGLAGAAGCVAMLADCVWGGFYDEEEAYLHVHGHDYAYGGVLALLARDLPLDVSDIALRKALPVTVSAKAEQVDFRLGETWVPGGIAELTTWMDDHLAVGSASRSHAHGMQNATYLAQWTRTGEPVETLNDLGQAYTRFIQNGRRPGVQGQAYRNHHRGVMFVAPPSLWADDGRPFVLQSGPTALILYVPKGQERRYVRSLEAMMVVPRPETVDAVLVDGAALDEGEAEAASPVVVQSGAVSLGLRFAVCDPALTAPRLVVERRPHHLMIGLRLLEFEFERELPESEYRRYGASIGAVLGHTPTPEARALFVEMLRASELSDGWSMGANPGDLGGPRTVRFKADEAELSGRFAPVAETWLRRMIPPAPGEIREIRWT